jgi:hypothetical protein
MPIVSITDHAMTEYTHNVVVSLPSNDKSHTIHYCTYIDSPVTHDTYHYIYSRFTATRELLGIGDNYNVSTLATIWEDDF